MFGQQKASIPALYRFISGDHLYPAPPCSRRPVVCTAQRRLRARPPAATECSVFWSMTGSTWNNWTAVVSASLRKQPRSLCAPPSGFSVTPRPRPHGLKVIRASNLLTAFISRLYFIFRLRHALYLKTGGSHTNNKPKSMFVWALYWSWEMVWS